MVQQAEFGTAVPPNPALVSWVEQVRKQCEPDRVFWCDGSEEEKAHLLESAVGEGSLTELDQDKLPGCYYHRSNANDVARVEQCTYICTPIKEDAGPTNNWA